MSAGQSDIGIAGKRSIPVKGWKYYKKKERRKKEKKSPENVVPLISFQIEKKGRERGGIYRRDFEGDKCGKERAPAARVMKYSIGSRHSRRQGRVARDQPEGQVPLPRSLALPLPSDLS